MRNIYKAISVFICVVGLNSCQYDAVNDNPYYMGETPEQIMSSAEKIDAAAIGMYDALQNAEFLGGRAQIYVDVRGLDVNPVSYFNALSTYVMTSTDGYASDNWEGGYRTIYEANVFLEGIEANKNLVDESLYLKYTGEARFIRAICYLYLLNFYGQQYTTAGDLGVPLITKAYDGGTAFTESLNVTRSTVADCYKFIVDDLKYAETNLPGSYDDSYQNAFRATKAAARAILSRAYLYQKDWDNAITYANKVISPSDGALSYELVKDQKADVFTALITGSKEIVFFVAHNKGDNPNTNNSLGQHYGQLGRADIQVNPTFVSSFEDTDTRKTQLLALDKNGAWWNEKYRGLSYDNAPIIRYAEVLLNKAEALVYKSKTVNADAISLINEIRTRSKASEVKSADFASWTELKDFILAERRRELCFEGHASFDLFRSEKGIPAGRGSVSTPAMSYPNDLFTLPIPNSDIQKNKNLVQNKGY
ncbi:MAG TPA: RagB/SusD family nutrient uptake outer membrane protein [Dysgonomonas sp.]|uniref:RagB/SusD family nutrient uptake outer membrane protein n=1 Tax=Dysgonomonas TaxID=156973 RepID=UPI0024BCFB9E|nr:MULTISPECIES: RagB/SusD family nutrient uptake outer membrane protein [unclassified Dysgonomonas]HML63442.1 RagB/SusD family nutrient uptake outer membrane protein [Dysgonomonas sp.]